VIVQQIIMPDCWYRSATEDVPLFTEEWKIVLELHHDGRVTWKPNEMAARMMALNNPFDSPPTITTTTES
jgi:hypothetical protein